MPRGLWFTRLWAAVAVTAPMVVLVAACGTSPAPDRRLVGTISVYAPTSLSEIMAQLAVMFESEHTGIDVRPTFGPDTQLSPQAAAAEGTPIVVNQAPAVVTELAAGTAVVPLANNGIVIAVALGDPMGITDLAGLARPDLRVALCLETEPCGAASKAALDAAGVTVANAIRVPDVRAARAAVEQGTADAALVYRTDTRAASTKVDTVEFVQAQAVPVRYQAAAPAGRGDPAIAKTFLDFLASPAAQEALSNAGFQSPSP